MATGRQRREAERRRLRRQARRRELLAARRRRVNVVISLVGVLVVVGVVVGLLVATSGSGSSAPKATGTPTPTAPRASASATAPASSTSPSATSSSVTSSATSSSATSSAAPSSSPAASSSPAVARTITCTYRRSGTPARAAAQPPVTAPATGSVTVRLATSQGALTLSLDRTAAPCAVNSFVSLARQKYFDATICHRLVTRSIYVLQCGDPLGTGRGGPGYVFDDELGTNPVFPRGSVVMANGGPNTNGSQFFLVDRDTRLGANYTPLGRISGGLAVLDRVYRAGVADGSTDGPPRLRVTLRSVRAA